MQNSDNISLIYEFNQDSPLFARVAEEEINKGNYSEAASILEKGLNKYPNYATAYFIYAIALANLSEYDKAEEAINTGAEILDSTETKEYYLERLNEIRNKNRVEEPAKRISFEDEEEIELSVPEEESIDSSNINREDDLEEELQIEDEVPLENRLEELASELEKAKMPPVEPELITPMETEEFTEELENKKYINLGSDEIFEDDDVVSETMAMILEGQGKYKEAINVYKKLKEKEPEKATIFELKIDELEQKLAGG
ncbi:MAG: hypothetical protein D6830_00895 [Ignavibacteria bacterium]|nr:MAG: hypothetical protein D6830_00895 [Ignavibacteria bacterium]